MTHLKKTKENKTEGAMDKEAKKRRMGQKKRNPTKT